MTGLHIPPEVRLISISGTRALLSQEICAHKESGDSRALRYNIQRSPSLQFV